MSSGNATRSQSLPPENRRSPRPRHGCRSGCQSPPLRQAPAFRVSQGSPAPLGHIRDRAGLAQSFGASSLVPDPMGQDGVQGHCPGSGQPDTACPGLGAASAPSLGYPLTVTNRNSFKLPGQRHTKLRQSPAALHSPWNNLAPCASKTPQCKGCCMRAQPGEPHGTQASAGRAVSSCSPAPQGLHGQSGPRIAAHHLPAFLARQGGRRVLETRRSRKRGRRQGRSHRCWQQQLETKSTIVSSG